VGERVVGHADELATVEAFLAARGETARALVVEGEAGIGKTTLVEATVARAASSGARVLRARPAEGELELPYAALTDLLEGVGPGALAALAPAQRAAVETALGRSRPLTPMDGHALARGVLELLRIEGRAGDLVIVIDDAQWLDRPTTAAVTFALRRLGGTPLGVVVAVRAERDAHGEPPLGLATWGGDTRRLVVRGMPATELGALLSDRLGTRLPRPRLEEIARVSGGNPMFALELARQALAGGTRTAPLATLPEALAARLRELDPAARGAVSFAAAALRPSPELLLRAGVTPEGLRAAVDTGIVRAQDDELVFAHPLLASAAYELLLPDELRDVHRRLASAASTAVERGHHLGLSVGGPDADVVATLEEAAREAASLGDHAGAAASLVRAAELAPDGDRDGERRVRAAEALELAGDPAGAAALAETLIAELPPGVPRAEARTILVSSSLGTSMSYTQGASALELALADAAGDDAVQGRLHLELATIASGMGRLADAVAHARAAVAHAERAGTTPVAVAALGEVGFAECMLGLGVTASAIRAYERWDGTIVSTNGYSPRMALACAYIHATEFDRAEALLREELELAEAQGLEPVEVTARGHLAEAQLRAGRLGDALANARTGVEHARQAANAQVLAGASYPLAMTEALLGRHDVARVVAADALAAADATDDFWFRVSSRAVLGLVALAENDAEGAVAALEPAWELMRTHGLGDLSIFPVAHVLGEALVAVGRPEDAGAIVAALRGSPVGTRPWSLAMADRCTALVASARGDHSAARTAIESALRAHAALDEPFERARTLQVAGRIEHRARNWGAARTALVAALEQFDSLGAARWAEKTAADIARLPGRRPGRDDGLSQREQEIAALAATGRTNKEIAAALYVSVRTVEANLSKAYAKLGVRSRSELAARMNRAPEGERLDVGSRR
jgi:DNA-binding NarL/FixJ family response regulator